MPSQAHRAKRLDHSMTGRVTSDVPRAILAFSRTEVDARAANFLASCCQVSPVEHMAGFLCRFGRQAAVLPTPPFLVRNFVTFREHDVLANCRIPGRCRE